MTLADKLKQLRIQEGRARGLHRALTQSDVARLIRAETGRGITQAYLSQLESGKRRHLTAETREQLARFFKVHPGYLVDDIPGSRRKALASELNRWLQEGHERLRHAEPVLADLFREMSGERNVHKQFELLMALRRDKALLKKLQKDFQI